jgi:hypothetical protein
MVSLISLVVPILIGTVISFAAGSVLHMLVRHHRSDFKKLPNEQTSLQTLKSLQIAPGDYFVPYPGSTPQGDAAFGAVMTVMRPGGMKLGSSLVQWFLYQLLVTFLCAYVASRTLPPATPYLNVFRVTGTVGFMAYSIAYMHESIWWQRSWSITLKYMMDGLIYALLTAGVFGWLWPR